MLKTIFWILGFILGMMCTIPVLLVYHILNLISGNKTADKFAYIFTRFWAKSIILTTGSKIIVIGKENLAQERNVCFISNHQGLFDIPALMGWLERPIGFIAKRELKRIPVLSGWIKAIHSAFIDRSNARKAIDSINQASNSIKQGHAIVIFPEGSRNKTDQVDDFKTGSLRLAFNSSAVIQPITIYGTRKLFETDTRIRKSEILIQVHKAIYPSDDVYKDKNELINRIHSEIADGYNDLSGRLAD